MTSAPTFADIKNAERAIAPATVRTPRRHSRTLSKHRRLGGMAEIRESAIHRQLQGTRRAEPHPVADARRAPTRRGGNVLEVSHNRMMAGIPAKSATLELVVEARDTEHAQEIRDRLTANRFRQA